MGGGNDGWGAGMTDGGREEGRMGRGKGRLGVEREWEAVRGFCAELGEIPAASAGMTDLGGDGAGEVRGWG